MDENTQSLIKSKFLEELNDVTKYMNMSKNATNDCDKQIFRDIAKEEISHAELLKMVIHKNNFKVTDAEHKEAQELYKKVKEGLESM